MRLLLATEFVGRWFLGAAFVFGVFLGVEPLSNRHEGGRKLGGAHLAKNLPRLCPQRDLHARGDLRDFQGQVIHRELLLDVLCAVRRAQRAFDERHDVVRDQGDAKAKQRGLGIAQRVHLTREIDGQMLKGGFDGPAVGVQARRSAQPGASATGRLVRICSSVSPWRVGVCNWTVIRRTTRVAPVSGSVKHTACS